MSKVDTFKKFINERNRLNDWSQFIAPSGKKISRIEVCQACKFRRSFLYQNKEVQGMLDELESALRAKGVLAPSIVRTRRRADVQDLELTDDVAHTVGVLEEKLAGLRRRVAEVSDRLDEYAIPRPDYLAGGA
jgi:hypothetical protein